MNDNDIIKAFDILDKFEFFGGQRAGRLLWFNKPADIQEKDIGKFNRDIDFLKAFINRQKAEIERLKKENDVLREDNHILATKYAQKAKAEAIKEFAERLKKNKYLSSDWTHGEHPYVVEETDIDNLVKEMTEGE